MAVRRLKEAGEKISALQLLSPDDLTFEAWHDEVRQLFSRNWPEEKLPDFWENRMRMPGEPSVTQRDLEVFRRGLATTKNQIDRILRNERELAEVQNDAKVTEIFLAPRSQYDAYQQIRQIISGAKRDLSIADNYVDSTIFPLLSNSDQGAAIRILTFSTPADFAVEARKFVQQYGRNLEVRIDRNDFHDRFIIVDRDAVFHLGHSIKDAGNKAMMIHRVEDPRNVDAAGQTFQATWAGANPFPI